MKISINNQQRNEENVNEINLSSTEDCREKIFKLSSFKFFFLLTFLQIQAVLFADADDTYDNNTTTYGVENLFFVEFKRFHNFHGKLYSNNKQI